MRVAALYDVHGNLPALEAVLADLGDVDAIVFGGDLLFGGWPRETLDRARSLDNAHFILGNWERALIEGDDEWTARQVSPDEVRDWPATLTLDGVVYCHATPRSDVELVLPDAPSSDWRSFTAPLTVCGHTHVQFDVERDGARIVNPGSIGNPTVRPLAQWAIVDGGDVELRSTAFDAVGTAAAMRDTGFPHGSSFADELLEPFTVERIVELIEASS
jgi:predicted phosphodiesterase